MEVPNIIKLSVRANKMFTNLIQFEIQLLSKEQIERQVQIL